MCVAQFYEYISHTYLNSSIRIWAMTQFLEFASEHHQDGVEIKEAVTEV